eukprot:EC690581.1.p1 GENE.EC690581.1~~EC690581.1.p1  ORF type:complete len:78 (-),score=4.95 EC690581.1:401-601(-)
MSGVASKAGSQRELLCHERIRVGVSARLPARLEAPLTRVAREALTFQSSVRRFQLVLFSQPTALEG